MTAESHPTTPPRASDSDPDPGAAAPRRLSEAEVQSLKAIIHDVKGPGAAETNHWELETMAPLNAASIVSFFPSSLFCLFCRRVFRGCHCGYVGYERGLGGWMCMTYPQTLPLSALPPITKKRPPPPDSAQCSGN